MQWQLEGDRPIYQQLVDQIMMQIVSGQRKAGDKLPAVRAHFRASISVAA